MSKKYTDRFSEAEKELSDKSAFICESCNKKYDKEEALRQYKDRFTGAEKELSEKSAFICESCNTKNKKKNSKKS